MEARVSALEERIEADLALGRHAELVGELESLVAVHPLRERLRGQLMLALYRSGRQAEALAAYRDARRVLLDELGLEPSPSLQQIEKAILVQDPSLERAATPAKGEPTESPHGTVTFLFTDIEGSTRLLKQLRDGYGEVLVEHQAHAAGGVRRARRQEMDTQGDSFFVAFRRARRGCRAAVDGAAGVGAA